ncbi:MAG TPA: DUF1385 domain-containing protein [Solirubrobacteraceae bacterium]|nr:DUF1385 domain-containing protein [Solirubrobacteraceae bacterium]
MTEDTRSPDGALTAQRDAPVGGQAVLEGVMMRGVSTWAVAVRAPLPEQLGDDGEGLAAGEAARGEIAVQSFPLVSWTKRHRALRWPVIRGVVALVESLVIGFRALGISANAQLGEEEEPISGGMWAGTVVAALALAIGLFFVLPVGVTSLFKEQLGSAFLFWLVEGLLRTAIFLGYLWLLSRLRDLRRVFEYHGAEHKVISTYEAGEALTPENARRYSRLHPRCGTSFLLIVMIVAIFVFAPLGLPAWYLLVASRILGVPLIAGLSFEVIKWAGRNRRKPWVRSVMWPGMQLQKLTTREPDLDQLAVAIAAMEAVLAVEDPRGASEEDRVGMEVVA